MYHKTYQMAAALALSIVLVASGLLVGLAPTSYAQGVLATRHIEQDEDEYTIIGSIDLSMRKMTSSADGDIIVRVMQEGEEVDSDTIDVSSITWMTYSQYSAEFSPVLNITDDFDIVVEHVGTGRVLLSSSINTSSETTTAGSEEEETGGSDAEEQEGNENEDNGNGSSDESDAELSEILANKVAERNIDDDMEVESVEFTARKMTSGTNGVLVVAIVEDGELVDAVEVSTNGVGWMSYTDLTAEFGEPVEAEGDFDVVVAHIGNGRILGSILAVTGTTGTTTNPQ